MRKTYKKFGFKKSFDVPKVKKARKIKRGASKALYW